MIRLVFLLRRKPELSSDAFYDYWLKEHGPLVASVANHLNVLRYVQVHTLADPANAAMAEARGGMEPPYDGVAELWFDNRDVIVDSFSSDAGRHAGAALLEDEANSSIYPILPCG